MYIGYWTLNKYYYYYYAKICLIADSIESLQIVCDNVSVVIEEYGMNVYEKQSKVMCINDVLGNRRWKIDVTEIYEKNIRI